MIEKVVLLNENHQPIGTALKSEVHTQNTQLHLAFSCFLFNSNPNSANYKKFLVTRRALVKKTWPGVWTNSFCGHPLPEEKIADAVKRRLQFELGITFSEKTMQIQEILPNYRYEAEFLGVKENEVCPVYVCLSDLEPNLNLEEVEEFKWLTWEEWLNEIKTNPDTYSFWCKEETLLLNSDSKFNNLISTL